MTLHPMFLTIKKITYSSGLQPEVCVPAAVRDDTLGRMRKKTVFNQNKTQEPLEP
jgi:hypothetical protein